MFAFVVRRLGISILVLFVATVIMYVLVANSGDPLDDLYQDQSPNKQAKIDARIAALNLNVPVPQRYLLWLKGVSGCVLPGLACDLGKTVKGQEVAPLLAEALRSVTG